MRFHEVLFWLLILLLPLQLGKHFWPDFSLIFGIKIDYLAPTVYLTDILVVLILGLWGLEKVGELRNLIKNAKVFLLVFLFFSFLVFSSLFSENPGTALYKFVKVIEFALLGFYIAKNKFPISLPRLPCRQTGRQAGNFQFPIMLAVVYPSIISIFQFLKQASLGGIFRWLGERSFSIMTPGIALGEIGGRLFLRPYGTFSHPNSLAGFLLVSLILVIYNKQQTINNKVISWMAMVLGIIAIILTFSRAVWLVGVVVGIWHVVKKLQVTNYKLQITLLFFMALIILSLANLDFLTEESAVQRIELTNSALLMIQKNPLSGVGLNNFIVRLPEFWQTTQIRLLQPVHNIYLLVTSEIGLVGLAVFLWFFYLTFKKLANPPASARLGRDGSPLAAGLVAILMLGLFDHYWLTLQQNQLLLAIVLGFSWGTHEGKNQNF